MHALLVHLILLYDPIGSGYLFLAGSEDVAWDRCGEAWTTVLTAVQDCPPIEFILQRDVKYS
jgi:hypothetical protein